MRRFLLIGLSVLPLALVAPGCNKNQPPEQTAGETQGLGEHRGRGGGFGHARMCDSPDSEARIAKMQKCQSETTAACNTQVYGSATPTKDAICGNKEKMRDVWKCVREKNGDDKEKFRAERKRMRECMHGAGGGEAKEGSDADDSE